MIPLQFINVIFKSWIKNENIAVYYMRTMNNVVYKTW